jgi:hypothetical protein
VIAVCLHRFSVFSLTQKQLLNSTSLTRKSDLSRQNILGVGEGRSEGGIDTIEHLGSQVAGQFSITPLNVHRFAVLLEAQEHVLEALPLSLKSGLSVQELITLATGDELGSAAHSGSQVAGQFSITPLNVHRFAVLLEAQEHVLEALPLSLKSGLSMQELITLATGDELGSAAHSGSQVAGQFSITPLNVHRFAVLLEAQEHVLEALPLSLKSGLSVHPSAAIEEITTIYSVHARWNIPVVIVLGL